MILEDNPAILRKLQSVNFNDVCRTAQAKQDVLITVQADKFFPESDKFSYRRAIGCYQATAHHLYLV